MTSRDPEDQISGSGLPNRPIWGSKMDTPGDPKSGVRRRGQMASNGIPRYGMCPLMAPWATYGYSMGFHGARDPKYPIWGPKMGPKWVILGGRTPQKWTFLGPFLT